MTESDNLLQKYAISIVETMPNPLLLLDVDLKIIVANPAFYRTFKYSPDQVEGCFLYKLSNHLWDMPLLRKLLSEILLHKTSAHDMEVDCEFPPAGPKKIMLHAQKLYRQGKNTDMILLVIDDITERKVVENALQTAHDQMEKRVQERTAELQAALCEIGKLKDQLEVERTYLQEEIKLEYNYENIIGQSDEIQCVFGKIEQVSSVDTNVLILGETGSGKELVARAIHNSSLRKNRSLVKINCATLPSSLIESELFGHEKGAFTNANSRQLGRFEIADGTTLFLDEIGELPMDLQPKLLRVIQDGEFERLGSSRTTKVDVRIIAATNRNLEEEVRNKRFREDLWYRLNVFPITMPPLRDRREDIPLLVDFYVSKISKRLGRTIKSVPKNIMATLQSYYWPGNIRELENVLERAVLNSSGEKLRLADKLTKRKKSLSSTSKTMETVERDHIQRVLEQTHWKVSGKKGAAEILGLNRSTLRARMRKLGIIKPRP